MSSSSSAAAAAAAASLLVIVKAVFVVVFTKQLWSCQNAVGTVQEANAAANGNDARVT